MLHSKVQLVPNDIVDRRYRVMMTANRNVLRNSFGEETALWVQTSAKIRICLRQSTYTWSIRLQLQCQYMDLQNEGVNMNLLKNAGIDSPCNKACRIVAFRFRLRTLIQVFLASQERLGGWSSITEGILRAKRHAHGLIYQLSEHLIEGLNRRKWNDQEINWLCPFMLPVAAQTYATSKDKSISLSNHVDKMLVQFLSAAGPSNILKAPIWWDIHQDHHTNNRAYCTALR